MTRRWAAGLLLVAVGGVALATSPFMPWVRMTDVPDADLASLLRLAGASATWAWVGVPAGLVIAALGLASIAWARDAGARALAAVLAVLVLAAGGVGVARLVHVDAQSYHLAGIGAGVVVAGLAELAVAAGLLIARRAPEGSNYASRAGRRSFEAQGEEWATGPRGPLRPGVRVSLAVVVLAGIGVGSFFAAGSGGPAPQKLIAFSVSSTAMAPTITKGDSISVDLSAYAASAPQRGNIIVFQAPPAEECGGTHGGDLIKRVIGLPGETISASGGNVYVTGKLLKEPWLPDAPSSETADFPATHVPAGAYFVMGDDRPISCDSRTWGPVKRSYIVGKVVKVVSPSSSTTTTTAAAAVLSPQSTPPVVAECSVSLQSTGNGNVSPLFCTNGGINVPAWDHYAADDLSVMNLGRSATWTSVHDAMCEDWSRNRANDAVESKAEQLVGKYNGWSFASTSKLTGFSGTCAS